MVLRHADAVITVSEFERTAIVRLYPAALSRLHAIQNGGLPAGLGVAAERWNKNSPRLCALCRFAEQTKEFSGCPRNGSPSGSKARLQFRFRWRQRRRNLRERSKYSGRYQISPHLRWPNRRNRGSKGILLQRRMPAVSVALRIIGLPPIEAMACGCPVIASDIPALRERCGDAAIYCDPADIDSITAAVERVIDDPPLRSSLKEMGYRQAKNLLGNAAPSRR